MSSKDTKETNVLAQASILMVAGIVTRIIGVLYRSPVTSIIGDEGNGYYSIAVNIYTMILLISSYSIPMAVSKVVSAKMCTYICSGNRWDCQPYYFFWSLCINSFESA